MARHLWVQKTRQPLLLRALSVGVVIMQVALWPIKTSAQSPVCVDGSSEEMRGVALIRTPLSSSFDVVAGEKRTLQIFVQQGPAVHSPKVCAEWSADPSSAALVDETTGTMIVNPNAKPNTSFVVRARIPEMSDVSVTFRVFDRRENPLVGKWHQEGFAICAGEWLFTEPIRELDITADGGFKITWHPFETYVDYWGRYEHDVSTGTIQMKVDGGNKVPSDFSGVGRFSVDIDGGLTLDHVWLGSPNAPTKPRLCSYQFKQA